MSNQDRLLSDEELAKKIMMEGYYNYRSNETFDDVLKNCTALINTQKRLYAESVIGEDEKLIMEDDDGLSERIRNLLRAEQRARNK